MKLWRPVGPKELALIEESDWKAFPPRLPEQPIFYFVLNFAYAEKIARDWNSTRADTGYRGYVTEFDVAVAVAGRYTPRIVGASMHAELWVPAEELTAFNAGILGVIRVAATYSHGKRVD